MDVDLESVEIVFAQRLASGEPVTRKRALKALQDWIQEQSRTNPFTEADMLRLAKGLHYVMWMQDKMVLQEELADRISSLLLTFKSEAERALFVKCMFTGLSKEWHSIDRWRMDKFLMLLRRIVRVLFGHLRNLEWKKEARAPYWQAFQDSAISPDKSFAEGLKFHLASIFLDEMDNAGGLTKKQMTACLKPYADLLGIRGISDYLFSSILEEIFMTILHQKSEEVAAMEDEFATDDATPNVSFDYKALGKMLFDIGKRPETTSSRRRKLYEVVKLFEVAAAGGDPMHVEEPEPEDRLKGVDFYEAEKRMEQMNANVRSENKARREERKMKRQTAAEDRKSAAVKETEENDGKELPKATKIIKKQKKKTRAAGQKISKRARVAKQLKKAKA